VRTECAAWALDRPTLAGVWAATSATDRQRAREAGMTAAQLIDATDSHTAPAAWHTTP
jgi:hypothetical protein